MWLLLVQCAGRGEGSVLWVTIWFQGESRSDFRRSNKHLKSNQVSQKTKKKNLRGKMSSLFRCCRYSLNFFSSRLSSLFWWYAQFVSFYISYVSAGLETSSEPEFFFGKLILTLLTRSCGSGLLYACESLKWSTFQHSRGFKTRPQHSFWLLDIYLLALHCSYIVSHQWFLKKLRGKFQFFTMTKNIF